eukprot:Tbor_TRINITY_DN5133_c0_g1::TRINITY_DN5133_c0_g1_i3::g.25972::m.25972
MYHQANFAREPVDSAGEEDKKLSCLSCVICHNNPLAYRVRLGVSILLTVVYAAGVFICHHFNNITATVVFGITAVTVILYGVVLYVFYRSLMVHIANSGSLLVNSVTEEDNLHYNGKIERYESEAQEDASTHLRRYYIVYVSLFFSLGLVWMGCAIYFLITAIQEGKPWDIHSKYLPMMGSVMSCFWFMLTAIRIYLERVVRRVG